MVALLRPAPPDLTDDDLVDDAECIGRLVYDGTVGRSSGPSGYRFSFPTQEHDLKVDDTPADPATGQGVRARSSRSATSGRRAQRGATQRRAAPRGTDPVGSVRHHRAASRARRSANGSATTASTARARTVRYATSCCAGRRRCVGGPSRPPLASGRTTGRRRVPARLQLDGGVPARSRDRRARARRTRARTCRRAARRRKAGGHDSAEPHRDRQPAYGGRSRPPGPRPRRARVQKRGRRRIPAATTGRAGRPNAEVARRARRGERDARRRHGLALVAREHAASPSTCCSSTKPARCRSPMRSPSRRRRGTWCCSAIRNSSPRPHKGSHPEAPSVSALEHLLGEHATMPPELGLFLNTTFRMHPERDASSSRSWSTRGELDVRARCSSIRSIGVPACCGAGLRSCRSRTRGRTLLAGGGDRRRELATGAIGGTGPTRTASTRAELAGCPCRRALQRAGGAACTDALPAALASGPSTSSRGRRHR